jgi:GNAT superfamily N-acetyltransferase
MNRLVSFSPGLDPVRLRACRALRYDVYHRDLELDMDDLDHATGLDCEARDLDCDFAVVESDDGRALGTIRMQPPGRAPYYAELEFRLLGPTWASTRFVEGARFAVTRDERGGPVPLLLFQAFRRYCRERGITDVLSVAIVPGRIDDRRALARLTRHIEERVVVAKDRGAPAPGYELEPSTPDELACAPPLAPHELSPMLRLLAGPRTTLASEPAYCRRFGTFNFLLTTRLP